MLYASLAYDQDGLDLNRLVRNVEQVAFENNYNLRAGNLVFEDLYAVAWSDDDGYSMASGFLGKDIRVDSRDTMTAGTIQSYSELAWHGWEYQPAWLIYGIDIQATDMTRAMATLSRADDNAIVARMLAGNDRFDLGMFGDDANGLGGNDTIHGMGGNDTLRGGLGNDRLIGGNDDDTLFLDAGGDVLLGGGGNDWVRVSGKAGVALRLDTVELQNTGLGHDQLVGIENAAGGNGNDRLTGSALANHLAGGAGNDLLNGLAGADQLIGGAGNDSLVGADGLDTLAGGDGNDRLNGGKGLDRLFGGAGADHFVFGTLADGSAQFAQSDVILDFQKGADVIDLSALDGSAISRGNNAFGFIGTQHFGTMPQGVIAIRHADRAGRAQDVTSILIDNDADPQAEMVIRLSGIHDLTASDFLL
ncbi:calcium-binding protein [Paracoccus fontiphilus]|uniref:Calcium-binding protein n=1 Tax=Paracoccus fontiphilus TaxID=1815556 RepID=A0ABV7I9Q1_9RHOB|nr:calcium-binding protein [Paracoccus fontiphilus]